MTPAQVAYYNDGVDYHEPFTEAFGVMSQSSVVLCPFLPPYDLSSSTARYRYMLYSYFGGWQYNGESKGLRKVGDSFTRRGKSYDVLVADILEYSGSWTFANHPAGGLTVKEYNSSTWLMSRREIRLGAYFNSTDLNFLKTDGSARTYRNVNPIPNGPHRADLELTSAGKVANMTNVTA